MRASITFTLAAALLAGCTSAEKNASAREWQKAECNRVIDKEDRDRCLKRVEAAYGRDSRDEPRDPPRR